MPSTATRRSARDNVGGADLADSMRAAVYRRFGGPEVVQIEQRPIPRPRATEVLVRVRASTVSAADYRSRTKDVPRGLAIPSALVLGFFRPRIKVLGMDVAGVVEAVGAKVAKFAVGDEVVAMLGSRFGGHAEYVTIAETGPIALKPRNHAFEESVSLVFGGVTARAFLSRAVVGSGTTVLVNGASGAVGAAAVQLAKAAGAHVTAVTSTRNIDLVVSLGADRVIDHTASDFATDGTKYDVIVDAVGNAPFARVERIINPGGALLQVAANLNDIVRAGRLARATGKTIVAGTIPFTSEDTAAVVAAAEDGSLRPVIDRTVDLADIVDAHRRVDTGRKRGSIVVRVSSLSRTAIAPRPIPGEAALGDSGATAAAGGGPRQGRALTVAVLILLCVIPMVAGTVRLVDLASGAPMPETLRFFASPAPIIIHVVTSLPYLILGALQFLPPLRRRAWHRVAGRVLVPLGLASALSAVWMTLFYDIPGNIAGPGLFWLRLLFGTSMVGALVAAVRAIRRKKVHEHAAWMARGYAIGLGAATQVVILAVWHGVFGPPDPATHTVLMGAGWVVNLAIAELLIARALRTPRAAGPGAAA